MLNLVLFHESVMLNFCITTKDRREKLYWKNYTYHLEINDTIQSNEII